jgi:Ca-activated chloride channel family protein
VWAAPLVIIAAYWGIHRRARLLEVFGYDRARSARWLASLRRRRVRRALLLAAVVLLSAAAALQPRCNPERTTFESTVRDVAILIDVSRSMLATDLQPSRLERAKLEVMDLLAPEVMRGNRVGIIAFAGEAVIKCPLTSNYSYVRSVVRNLSPKSASQGGTMIGDAVRKALRDLLGLHASGSPEGDEEEKPKPGETVIEEELEGKKESHADIILITDGEDLGSHPEYAARAAAANDVGIYAVGIGSEDGKEIAVQGEGGRVEILKGRDGEIVRSRLDSKTLQAMVNMCPRGQYLPAGTNDPDLVGFYENTIGREEGRSVTDEQVAWTEIFQPFLLAAIGLYVAHLAFSERPRHGRLSLGEGAA